MNSMGMPNMPAEQVYNVPWRVWGPNAPAITSGLILYWFPSSVQEVQKSSLRTSRVLSLYAAQCISMEIADASSPIGKQLASNAKLPIAVLTTPDGQQISRMDNDNGMLRADPDEKMVDNEFKKRDNQLDQQMKQA